MALKRVAGEGLTLYRNTHFPARIKRHSPYRYRAVIGIGGNVGDVRRRFERLSVALQRAQGVDVMRTGPVLKNPPFGFLDQSDFFNSVIEIATSMQPQRFLRFMLETERRFGRRRSFPNAPRTLDLDVLFFDGRVIDTPTLKVPHPHWHERESVVIPLAYFWR